MFNCRVIHYILCALVIAPIVAAADDNQDRWYDVELIIFENLDAPESPNTYWHPQAYIPIRENLKRNTTQSLPNSTYRLKSEANKIQKSSRYELLSHRSWRFKGAPLDKSIPVRIRRGEEMAVFAPNDYLPAESAQLLETEINPLNTRLKPSIPLVENFRPVFLNTYDQQFANYSQTLAYPLDGTVTISLGRYLHVYTDLALTKRRTSGGSPGLQTYFFKDHRRMRSRKLHYIDHPKMGMLVLITPYEKEEDS